MTGLQILPVEGIPELRPGADLTTAITAAAPWLQDGDVVVVTSKVVSKVEGRLLHTPPGEREAVRQAAIDSQTVRVVASRGATRIVQNHQGFVVAAAGVDASNIRTDEIALLPVDSDASARRLRTGIAETLNVDVAVVITDTAGRPWRTGVTDYAVGAAGIRALNSLRGVVDPMGNELAVTEIAVVDELAAAGDLVKGKLSAIPVAVVRGLSYERDDDGVRPLVRPSELDLFRLGTAEAIAEGRRQALELRPVVREFADKPVDPAAVDRALHTAVAGVRAGGWRLIPLPGSGPMHILACLERSEPAAALALGAAAERLFIALRAEDLYGSWLGTPADPTGVPGGMELAGLIGVGHPLTLDPVQP